MQHKMIVLAAAASLAHSASAGFAPFASRIQQLQESMVKQAKSADPTATWTVDEHSRGKACIIEDGEIWEKGCISVTLIEDGELSAVRAATISGRTGTTISEGARYSACALSFVLHAYSPLVPTLRGDARIFVACLIQCPSSRWSTRPSQTHLLAEMMVQMTRIAWYFLNMGILVQMMVQTHRAVDLPPE